MSDSRDTRRCQVAAIWMDWYPYHVARFRGLESRPELRGRIAGIELVGGVGVHTGLKFREPLPEGLAIETLMESASWGEASKVQLARMLWNRLGELQPEVVLVPGYYTLPAIAAAVWARVHGRGSVLMTESTESDHTRKWWKELPKRLALRALFNWAVTGGTEHVAYLRTLGFPPDRIVGCYDVVDNELFRQGAITARRDAMPVDLAASPYFLYVGRLAEEKNVAGLVESWMAYRDEGGTWPLLLCGDGPERSRLQVFLAGSAHEPDVHISGLKTLRELLPFYAHAGCLILPSTREPWGLVVNEAMATGLPVLVSTRCGSSVDLVEVGVNGYTFDPRDASALTRLLHQLERLSESDRARMGQRSAEIVDKFTPAGFGEAIATIVRSRRAHTETDLVAEVAQ